MKRIFVFAIAALLAMSMSAFADDTKPANGKSCDKAAAAECQKKDAECTKKKCAGDTNSCPKHDAASCKKTADKH